MKIKSSCHTKFDTTFAELNTFIAKHVRQFSCTELIRGKWFNLSLHVLDDEGYLREFEDESSTDEAIDWANFREDADGVEPVYIDEEILKRIRNGAEATDLLTEEEIESIYVCIEVDLLYNYIFSNQKIVDPPHYETGNIVDGDVLLFRIPDSASYFDWVNDYAVLTHLNDKNQLQFEIEGFKEFTNLACHARCAANMCARLKQSKIPSFIEICAALGISFEITHGNDDLGTLLGWCPECDLATVLANASRQVDALSESVASIWKQSCQSINALLERTDEIPSLREKLRKAHRDIDDVRLKLKKSENEKQIALAERDAYKFFYDIEANGVHYGALACCAGPLQYKDKQLRIIVSVNKVLLPESSVWKQVARKLLSLKPFKVFAVDRIVQRPLGGRSMLSFNGTVGEWANIEHLFDRDRYKLINDRAVEWDWEAELERDPG